jgi:2-polyprenyl-6-methoxyphenol hydroxylase-like FAD-dependent oxidoreductase
MDIAALRVAVIGGSLGGLSVANALEHRGAAVTVFERGAAGFERRGGGLGVTPGLAAEVTSGAEPPHMIHDQRHLWVRGEEWDEPAHIPVTSYGALWR